MKFDADLAYEQAQLAFEAGHPDLAEELLEAIVRAHPDHLPALLRLGARNTELKRFGEAELIFAATTTMYPECAEAYNNLAVVLLQVDRAEEALEHVDQALRIIPDYFDALLNRGVILCKLERWPEAIGSCERALVIRPDSVLATYQKAIAEELSDRPDDALVSYEAAIALAPQLASAIAKRGKILKSRGRIDEALACFDEALAIDPTLAEAHNNRGNLLKERGQLDEALACYRAALRLDPIYARAHYNHATVLHEQRHLHDALEGYNSLLAINGSHIDGRWNRALALLTLGRFKEGWPDYEWRWRLADQPPPRATERPIWLGKGSLTGKRILLWGEQGLGDQIQFVRFATPLAAMGAVVHVEVREPLVRLFATLDGVSAVRSARDPAPDSAFDLHCPLMSLPLALAIEIANLPGGPYLRCPPERTAQWRARLGERAKPRIGLMWRGGKNRKIPGRSIGLTELGALLGHDFDWISLQKDIPEEDSKALNGFAAIRHFGAEQGDFLDAAALCECCDLIISVDTSIAHLAGALGRPVWILLSYSADWRWLDQREDSPWYPTARLFRQSRAGDWAEMVDRVRSALTLWRSAWKQEPGRQPIPNHLRRSRAQRT